VVRVPEPSGRHAAVGVPGTDPTARSRVEEVLAGDALGMVFQPVVDLATGATVGHEALARFADGRPPNVWFDEAERAGLGVELELLAIETALRILPAEVPGYLGANVSPSTLASSRLRELLQRCDGHRRLLLEVTEQHAVAEFGLTKVGIAQMEQAGVLVALDELGSGTASLRQLVDLNPDVVKLDRSLVSHVDEDVALHAMAAGFSRLAEGMGWTAMAVGIERHEELAVCHEMGVTYGQGYLLGRPAPLADPAHSPAAAWIALSEEIWQASQE
jgi:EAL domain-containing protein (putative c-di-GMP-specific phosphodiesterase class I)